MRIFNGKGSGSDMDTHQQSAPGGVAPSVQVDEPEGAAERKRLIALGAIGGAVAIGALGFFVVAPALSSGSSSSPTVVTTHHAAAGNSSLAGAKASSTPKPAASATPSAVGTVPATAVQLAVGRDPFVPLITPPPPTPTTTPSAESTTPAATATTTPSATSSPSATPVS